MCVHIHTLHKKVHITHTLNCTIVYYILKIDTTHTIHINTHKKQKEKNLGATTHAKKEEPFFILVILNFIFCFTGKHNVLIFK